MRSHGRLLALVLAIGLGAAGCGREPPRTELPPNVIVYLVDTLRRDHLSVYGYSRETSPRLAEFARDAVRFETAYSPTSWTKPAVASLLTGVTPLRHGAISQSNRLDPGRFLASLRELAALGISWVMLSVPCESRGEYRERVARFGEEIIGHL